MDAKVSDNIRENFFAVLVGHHKSHMGCLVMNLGLHHERLVSNCLRHGTSLCFVIILFSYLVHCSVNTVIIVIYKCAV